MPLGYRTIFSQVELTPSKLGFNRTSLWGAYDLDPYLQNVTDAMNGLIKKVSDNSSLHGFATTQIDLSSSHTWRWRGLAQCTPDILGNPCYTCLSAGFKQWDPWAITDIFLPSCLIRFDLYGSPPPSSPGQSVAYVFGKTAIIKVNGNSTTHVRNNVIGFDAYNLQVHMDDFMSIIVQSPPYFTADQYNKLIALSNKHDLETSIPTPRETTSAAMLVVVNLPMEEKWISVDGEIRQPRTARVKIFSYSEIDNMTSGFQRRLGEGGFGYVYYGCLAEGKHSKDVAIKVLSKDAPKQFSTEHLLAAIADFGFSKIFPDDYISVLSTRVIGTPGYIDPQPMLERRDLESIVDPRLPQVQNCSSLWRATDLAVECVNLSASERPAMSHIASGLKECLAMEMEEMSPIARDSNSMEIGLTTTCASRLAGAVQQWPRASLTY
ncbi:hypothetical protein Cgig2_016782 [Carnegiea gigantea]|uniref:Gnk2-homologous domain-containing protein n=1 Tax=Carnegiea gigantea TaxID=171969 RepID=A0A9Q1GPM8_9CARY|nr:hypothetical protein Cgig2_016782 [Carnegiea gigantea]